VSSPIVLIGPADALPALQARLDPGAAVEVFTDGEALEALDHIIRTRPAMVALQDEFSATSRGIALINRIKDDPSLAACEVRVLTRDREFSRVTANRAPAGSAAIALDEPAPALDQRGTRRAPRIPIQSGVEVTVDGNPSELVDLSMVGAQVVSATVLRPNQRVRVVLGQGAVVVRCSGAVAWAAFEMPKGMPTRYRAGIDWGITAEGPAIEAFAEENKK